MDRVRIRPLRSYDDYQACVEIQRVVWGHADLDITPIHHFCISVETGAILLGAFVGKTMAGYVYSFPSVLGKKHCQHSHQLAVLPEFQGYGFGKKLKWAQWGETVKRGYDLITWTYDPMQARNANLNLHILGAVGRTYLDDFYGGTPALKLDDRVPTDRLLVEWAITSRRVERRMEGTHAPLDPAELAPAVEQKPGGVYPVIVPRRPDLSLDAPRLLVELPKTIRDLKPVAGLVGRWQKAVRTALKHYFRRGYRLDDFIFGDRTFYVLKKG
jgi:predicted GNAT superfamily acetyltransferase